MIDNADFNVVRNTLAALADPTAAASEASFQDALLAFDRIESDVERLMRELEGEREASRQLRTALEEPDPLYR